MLHHPAENCGKLFLILTEKLFSKLLILVCFQFHGNMRTVVCWKTTPMRQSDIKTDWYVNKCEPGVQWQKEASIADVTFRHELQNTIACQRESFTNAKARWDAINISASSTGISRSTHYIRRWYWLWPAHLVQFLLWQYHELLMCM